MIGTKAGGKKAHTALLPAHVIRKHCFRLLLLRDAVACCRLRGPTAPPLRAWPLLLRRGSVSAAQRRPCVLRMLPCSCSCTTHPLPRLLRNPSA